ncbi:hypothetical protein X908_05575 [Campylobacter jejuni subsp. jejuni 81-176-DRH212]|nr:hypothetical protein FORC46_1002 [Campylobacter jejuni]ETJ82199.1 hypothetical protein X908_05575 [Campylobacter jejuni subsp. jejuni 81-176-DRH212]ETJ83890.1 hypothetical protein X909_05530 [Campylobacter jejuni subsp. jejuni 81-176-UMCW7]
MASFKKIFWIIVIIVAFNLRAPNYCSGAYY